MTPKPRKGYRYCSKCKRNRQFKFFKPNGRVCLKCQRGRAKLATRDVRLQETYGITQQQYEQMVEYQGGVCAICGGKRSTNYDVDHDHKSGIVRGALCRLCNRRLLTACRDNPDILRAAIAYLEDPPAVHAIGRIVVPDSRHNDVISEHEQEGNGSQVAADQV